MRDSKTHSKQTVIMNTASSKQEMDKKRSWDSRRYSEITIAIILGLWCWYYPFGKCYIRVPKKGKSRKDGIVHIIVVDVVIVTQQGNVSLKKIAEQYCSQFKGRYYEESISNFILSMMRNYLELIGFTFEEKKTKSSGLQSTGKKYLLKRIKSCCFCDINLDSKFITTLIMKFCDELPNRKVGVDVCEDLSLLLKSSTELQTVVGLMHVNITAENMQNDLEVRENEQLSIHSLELFAETNEFRGFTQNNSGSEQT